MGRTTVIVMRTVEVEIEVEVTLEEVEDTDGLPGPGITGNSMTGSRGTYWEPVDYEIATSRDDIDDQIHEVLNGDDWADAVDEAYADGGGPDPDDEYERWWDQRDEEAERDAD